MAVLGAEHSPRISETLLRLQDTTAEIRIRASFVLLAVFVVLAERLELEAILGAFFAGAIIKLIDRDRTMTHPQFRVKLEAVGYGVFVPFFFVSTGVMFDLDGLFASGEATARVPIFLGALLIARGLPALVYRPLATRTQTAAAAVLQATSLSFLVVAGQIGVQLDLIRPATYAALVAAGLLSVLLFPLTALRLLRAHGQSHGRYRRGTATSSRTGRRGTTCSVARDPVHGGLNVNEMAPGRSPGVDLFRRCQGYCWVLSHLVFVCGERGHNLPLLQLGNPEEVERSPEFSRDFVELVRRDSQFAVGFLQSREE